MGYWNMIGGVELQPQSRDLWCEAWNASVEQVGRDIKTLREAQGLTLQAVHMETKVPLYHLRSLEAGTVDKLPDAIFVRGFLKKICQCLGPEGKALMAKLPEAQSSLVAKPTTHPREAWRSRDLNVSHLYVGYGLLLAGAMGGLAWTDQNGPLGHEYLGGATQQSSSAGSAEGTSASSRSIQALASPSVAPPTFQGPEFGL